MYLVKIINICKYKLHLIEWSKFSSLKQVIKITYFIYFMNIILLLYIEKRRIKNYYSQNLYDDLFGFFFSRSTKYPNILWNIVNNRTIHNACNYIFMYIIVSMNPLIIQECIQLVIHNWYYYLIYGHLILVP